MLMLQINLSTTPPLVLELAYADLDQLERAVEFVSRAELPQETDALPAFLASIDAVADHVEPPVRAVLSSDHQRAGEALQQLLARHDGDMTVPLQVLRRFGANSLRDLPPGDCGAFVAACAAA